MRVLGNNIIVLPIYTTMKGGIILPEISPHYKKYHGAVKGLVMAVGPKYLYDVKVGDTVLWRRHEGKPFVFERKRYFKLKERWVECLVYD